VAEVGHVGSGHVADTSSTWIFHVVHVSRRGLVVTWTAWPRCEMHISQQLGLSRCAHIVTDTWLTVRHVNDPHPRGELQVAIFFFFFFCSEKTERNTTNKHDVTSYWMGIYICSFHLEELR
jgi:hypothetical protein